MHRLATGLLFSLFAACSFGQTTSQPAPTSDAQAVTLVQQSIAALTGGAAISDVTLNANVSSILGPDKETGTETLTAKGLQESRLELTLGGGTRSDVRNTMNGVPEGAWKKDSGTSSAYAQHNCWTDAAWFFPAFSSLTQTANPNYIFKYIGQEEHGGIATQHLRVFQIVPQDTPGIFQLLSESDFYLETAKSLLEEPNGLLRR